MDIPRFPIAGVPVILLSLFLLAPPAESASLNAITRFPHQDTTKSNSQALPLTLSGQGLMFVWAESTAVRYSKSTDGGATWGQPVQFVTPVWYVRNLTGIRTLSGRILLFWSDSGGVRYIMSDDEGLTWFSVSLLTLPAQQSLHVSQTDDGKLWLASQPAVGAPRYLTSTDNGSSWGAVQYFPAGGKYDACFVDGQGGSLHCIYASGVIGQTDIRRITSTDGGTTWLPATAILGTPRAEKRPRMVKQSNGTLRMVYVSERIDSTPPVYSRFDISSVISTDGGITWGSPEAFTRFVGDDLFHDVTMLNDEPFVTFASNRWVVSPERERYWIWFGIIGETPDDAPPPIFLGGSTFHMYSGVENWIRASVDDETGIAAVTADYYVNGVPQPALQLFDDGSHGDGGPGDNIWANSVASFPTGFIECFLLVRDSTGNAIRFFGFGFNLFDPPGEPVVQGTSMKVTSDTHGTLGRTALPTGFPGFGLRYPAHSTIEHLYGSGLWIGGKVDTTAGGTGERIRAVSTAYEGWAGPLKEFFPPSASDSIWRIFGINATMPPGWEQYWGTGLPFRPRADQNFYNKYNDYTEPLTGHVPMGVQIIQSSYTWDDQSAAGIQILDFRLMNNSFRRIDSAYVGLLVDGDVGPHEVVNYYMRNFSGYIASERMGYIHNPVDVGSTPLGVSILNTHRPWDSLRFTFRWFPGNETPSNDASKYALMNLGTIRPDEYPSLSDTRFVLSFGPFTILPYTAPNPDTLRIAFALLSALDVTQLQQRAGRARDLYAAFTDVEQIGSNIPAEFALEQNFPNPFNPSTKVRFGIARSAFTTLEIFDILGRTVAVLLNEEKIPGVYEVEFDGSGLASGLYFYRLRAGAFSSVRKALLLR